MLMRGAAKPRVAIPRQNLVSRDKTWPRPPDRRLRPRRRSPARRAVSRSTRGACEDRARSTSLVVEVVDVIPGAQVIPEDVLADLPPQVSTPLLVEAEVDAAVDPGVVDVVGDLLP